MALVDSLRKAASNAIGKLGGDVTVRYVTAGAYNTTTGASAETTTDVDVAGIVGGVIKSEVNDLIQAEDKRLKVAASDLDTVPTTKDRVVIDSVVYQIISINTSEQANEPVTFELILRS